MKRQRGYEETERKVKKVKVDEHAPDEEDARSEVDEQKKHMTEVGPTLEALRRVEVSWKAVVCLREWRCVHFLAFLSTEMCL